MRYLIGMIIILMTSGGSCSDIDYNGKNRLMVKGKVMDKNGNPIQGIDVETEVYGVDIYVNSDIISFTKTDADGNFVMLFPEPEKGTRFRVKLEDENELYHYKAYTSVKKEDFRDYGYDLGEIRLFEPDDLVGLFLDFQTNSGNQITHLKLIGNVSGEYYVNPINEYWLYNYTAQVAKNQTITIEYNVRNFNNQNTTYIENIEIGTEDFTYTLNY